MSTLPYLRQWLWPVSAIVAILLGSLLPLKKIMPAHLVAEITNTLHYPSGIVLALMLLPLLRKSPRLAPLLWAGAVLMFGAIEIIQPFFGRTGNLPDWLQSSAGITIGLLFTRINAHTPAALKRLLFTVTGVLLYLCASPLFQKVQILLAHEQQFPLIADFESEDDLRLWKPNRLSDMVVESRGEIAQSFALQDGYYVEDGNYARVIYPANTYPRATYIAVNPDWRGYRNICFDARAMNAEQILAVHLLGKPGRNADSYLWKEFSITPLWHNFCVDLGGKTRTTGKTMDLSQIYSVSFFGPEKRQSGSFDLDNVRLVK